MTVPNSTARASSSVDINTRHCGPDKNEQGAAPIEPDQLRQWDAQYLWHPFTPHAVYADEAPLIVDRGKGHYLITTEGRRYLDGVGSLWCNLFGHRHPHIDRAIRKQLDRIAHSTLLGNSNSTAIQLARRMIDHAPKGLTRVFFSDNGSTTVEVALKMAVQYWQQVGRPEKRRVVGLEHAYHGDTLGAVSVGGISLFHERFGPLLFDSPKVASPHCFRCSLEQTFPSCQLACTASLEQLFARDADSIAALVVEPGFQGAAGILTQPDGWLRRVADLAKQYDVLLIADEVASGMGRTGHMFACQREQVTPDLLCVAKGLTAGYLPLAATIATETIFDAFVAPPELGHTFFHGHTFSGNALGAAAGLATLDLFERERILDRVQHSSEMLRAALQSIRNHPAVGDVRQIGLAVGIELVADRSTKRQFPASERRGMRVCVRAQDRGVFLRPLGDVVVLMPPLTISEDEIRQLVDAVAHGIDLECSV